jgi:predicted RNase H-like HicB family nuclease/predicted nucleotidyltransferase
MTSYGWSDAPLDTRYQTNELLQAMRQVVGANLIGLYLHGSLAMGCFNPNCSDLDVIAVTAEGMAVETKRAVAAILLQQSGAPHPIEVSFLRRRDLAPWRYPTPFDFHYKEGGAWAEGALPSELQLVIRQALAIYRGESVDERFAPERLDAFVHYVEERVSGMLNYVPAVPGCYTQGRTFDQARRRIREALSLWVDDVSTATYIR